MGIHHDIAFSCLAKDLGQHHHRKAVRLNDVFQHASRPHARKLVPVAYQNQPCPRDDCAQQGMHERKIHHGHLVNNNYICFQRILFIAPESIDRLIFWISADFQKAVDGLGLISGGLGHPLGRPSRGGRKTDIQPLALKKMYHGIDGCSLSRSRASGQYQDASSGSLHHRCALHVVQIQAGIFFNSL